MAEEQGGERTEEATPRKREKAREEGQVARSQEAGVAVTMFVLVATLNWLLPASSAGALQRFRAAFDRISAEPFTADQAGQTITQIWTDVLSLVLPVAFLAMLGGVAMSLAQVGFQLNLSLLQPKPDRLNPANWLKRMFSAELPVTLIKSLFKGLGVASIAILAMEAEPSNLWRMAFGGEAALLSHIREVAAHVISRVAAAMAVVAMLDYGWAKYRFEEQLKMSKQEQKEEMKESEGNPQQKGELRRRARDMAQGGLAEQLKEATVVATNPTHYAVALRYQPERDGAPMVLARGVDHKAARIKKLARENNIPVIEDRPLARALHALTKEGDTVPQELYKSVAKLLAIVYARRGGDR